jgi:O-antigen/teichoic acid export membrane protein
MSLFKKRSGESSRLARVSKNAAVLIGSKIVTSGLSFFLVIVINRELGPVYAGIYAYAFTLYSIFMILPDFGLGNISVRDVAQDHSKMSFYLRNVVIIRLALGLLTFLLLLITDFATALASSPASFDQKFWTVLVVGFCMLLEGPLSNSLAECFVAVEKLTLVAYVYIVIAVVKVTLSLYIIYAGFDPVLVLLALVYLVTIAYSIVHFFLLYRRMMKHGIEGEAEKQDLAIAETLIHTPELPEGVPIDEALLADYTLASLEDEGTSREVPPAQEESESPPARGRFGFDRELCGYLLRSAWPLFIIVAGITIYAYVDVPVLSWVKGDKEVGLYNAAGMFAKSLVYLSLGINMAVLPAVSKVKKSHEERLGAIWERMLTYMFLFSAFLAVVVPLLARPVLIIQRFDFIDTWPVVWLTMATLCFTSLSAVSFPFFVALDKQKKAAVVVYIVLLIKVVILLAVVPFLGYTGAAITVLTTEMIGFFLYYKALSPELGHRIKWLRTVIAPACCLGVAYLCALAFTWFFIRGDEFAATFMGSVAYAVAITAVVVVVFVALVVGTRLISRKSLRELNELLKVD